MRRIPVNKQDAKERALPPGFYDYELTEKEGQTFDRAAADRDAAPRVEAASLPEADRSWLFRRA